MSGFIRCNFEPGSSRAKEHLDGLAMSALLNRYLATQRNGAHDT